MELHPYDNNIKIAFFTLRKKYKKLLKSKEKTYRHKILNQLENLQEKNPKEYWRLIKLLTDDTESVSTDIKITDWQEHFKKLNNDITIDSSFHEAINSQVASNVNSSNINIEINTPITVNEIINAIRKLKLGKAHGPDNICNEMIKYSANILIDHYKYLFSSIFESTIFPNCWRTSYLTPIHKKGDINSPNNYRGIAVGSALGKVFLSIINTRISDFLENNDKYDKAQNGFRKDHRTSDNIFIFKTMINKIKLLNKKLFVCFVDFSKAFDTVWRNGLLFKLQNLGINGNALTLLKNMYNDVSYIVKVNNEYSDLFHSNIGVRQGCVCSPTLFNIYVNDIRFYLNLHIANINPPILNDTYLTHLMFADDIVLFSQSEIGLQNSLHVIEQYCKEWKLKLNTSKTKIMVFNNPSDVMKYRFMFNNSELEMVEEYLYLGYVFTSNGKDSKAILNLKNKSLRSWYMLKQRLCTEDNMSTSILLKIFKNVSQQICLYGSEIWGSGIVPLKSRGLFQNWNKDNCNQLLIKVSKSILSLSKYASSIGSLVELGLYPLSVNVYINMIKYKNRISNMDADSFVHKAFLEDIAIGSIKGKLSLHHSVGRILSYLNIGNETDMNINVIKQKLLNSFQNKFVEETLPINPVTNKSNKLSTYGKYKVDMNTPVYLLSKINRKYKSALTQLRLSSHCLMIEQGRYRNIDANERFCPFCKTEKEDEIHFALYCPLYKNLRTHLFSDISLEYPSFKNMEKDEKFQLLFNPPENVVFVVCKYIYECFSIRKQFKP